MITRLICAAAGLCLLVCGCSPTAGPGGDYLKPTIAVMKFENRASFLGWKLGDGMADILVDRLVAAGRFQVVERPELGAVVDELRIQKSGMTRPQNKAQSGRLKNAQYLIKGTITDFGHVSGGSGFLGLGNLSVFGSSNRAIMGMTVYVVDVESGEIICSQSLEESVRAGDMAVKAVYKDVAFGGTTFYRTPLGKATARVIDRAVRQVSSVIASRPWEPKVAMVQGDGSVVINGGQDRGVRAGQQYDVLKAGEAILDPDTGDVLGSRDSVILARVRVIQVEERYCVASVVAGGAAQIAAGSRCRQHDGPQ